MTAQLPSFYQRGNVDLRGPKGDKGDKGDQGIAGPPGEGKIDREAEKRLTTVEGDMVKLRAKVSDDFEVIVTDTEALARRTSSVEASYERIGRETDIKVAAAVRDESIARASALEAQASRVSTVEASYERLDDSVTAVNAKITDETRARASAVEAVATRLSTVEASYTKAGDVDIIATAKVSEERIARTNADSALASRLSTLEASYSPAGDGVDTVARAMIEEERRVRSDADSAEALARDRLAASIRTETDGKVGAEATARSAAILVERDARIGEREATARRLETIEASYVTSGAVDAKVNAKVSEEATARATAVSAVASRVSNLEASTGGPVVDNVARAAVKTEEDARVSAVAAVASRSSRLEAQMARTSPSALGTALTTVDARVTEERQARIDSVGAVSSRLGTVEANYVTSGAVDFKVNAKVSEEATARAQADQAEATARTQLAATLRGETDSKVSAAVSAESASRVEGDRAMGQRIDTVEAARTSGGNMLTNTDFPTTDGWYMGNNPPSGGTLPEFSINAAGPLYHPVGENVLSIVQGAPNGAGAYSEWSGEQFAVTAGQYIQFYAFCNCHRANVEVILAWRNFNGQLFDASSSGEKAAVIVNPGTENLGMDIAYYAQLGKKSVRVPEGATSAYLILRKYDTYANQANSYAWFLRPYAAIAREGQTSWNPYGPGSGRAVQIASTARARQATEAVADAASAISSRLNIVEASYATTGAVDAKVNAKVSEEATARAQADSANANRSGTLEAQMRREIPSALNTYVDGVLGAVTQARSDLSARIEDRATAIADAKVGALASTVQTVKATADGAASSVQVQSQAIADLNGKTSARFQIVTDNGGGQARLTVVADGFPRVVIDGDLELNGRLIQPSTIATAAIAPRAVTDGAAYSGGSVTFRDTAHYNAASVTHTGSGGRASIIVSGVATLSPGAPAGTYLQMIVSLNGSPIVGPVRIVSQRGVQVPFSFPAVVNSIDGITTATMSVQATGGVGTNDPHIIDIPSISITEFKK